MREQPVKIQLNLAALERLIGGSSEAEVELRQSVVENFTHRHLKALANEKLVQAQELVIKRYVDDQIGKESWQGVKLSPKVVEELRKVTRGIMQGIINEELLVRYEEMKAKIDKQAKALEKEALERITLEVSRLMPENIENVINAEVERRLLAAAGIVGKGAKK